MRLKWLPLTLLLAVSFASAQQSAPALFFTDLTNGPNTGGETVSGFSGVYVTLYGNFFGTTQGTSTVTWNSQNCLHVVTWGTSWLWYQKIVVQLGFSCTAGSGNFVVSLGYLVAATGITLFACAVHRPIGRHAARAPAIFTTRTRPHA